MVKEPFIITFLSFEFSFVKQLAKLPSCSLAQLLDKVNNAQFFGKQKI